MLTQRPQAKTLFPKSVTLTSESFSFIFCTNLKYFLTASLHFKMLSSAKG